MKKTNGKMVMLAAAVLVVVNGFAFALLTDDLVAKWSFDETAGIVAGEDVSGFDATIIGGANFADDSVPGRFGGAIKLRGGSNEMIQNNDVLLRSVTQKLSMSVWIKPSADLTSANFREDILSWNGAYNHALRFNLSGDGKIVWYPQTQLGVVAGLESSQTSWSSEQWYNIVVTGDLNTYKLYINGNLEASVTDTSGGTMRYAQDGLTIGNRKEGVVDFNGAIDEVGVWDRALTKDEVEMLYTQAIPEPASLMLLSVGAAAVLRKKRK